MKNLRDLEKQVFGHTRTSTRGDAQTPLNPKFDLTDEERAIWEAFGYSVKRLIQGLIERDPSKHGDTGRSQASLPPRYICRCGKAFLRADFEQHLIENGVGARANGSFCNQCGEMSNDLVCKVCTLKNANEAECIHCKRLLRRVPGSWVHHSGYGRCAPYVPKSASTFADPGPGYVDQ